MNRDTDLREKKDYACVDIRVYIIIDRHKSRIGKPGHRPCILVGKLRRTGGYAFTRHTRGEISLHHFGKVSDAKLFNAANANEIVAQNAKEQHNLREKDDALA